MSDGHHMEFILNRMVPLISCVYNNNSIHQAKAQEELPSLTPSLPKSVHSVTPMVKGSLQERLYNFIGFYEDCMVAPFMYH